LGVIGQEGKMGRLEGVPRSRFLSAKSSDIRQIPNVRFNQI